MVRLILYTRFFCERFFSQVCDGYVEFAAAVKRRRKNRMHSMEFGDGTCAQMGACIQLRKCAGHSARAPKARAGGSEGACPPGYVAKYCELRPGSAEKRLPAARSLAWWSFRSFGVGIGKLRPVQV